MSVATSKLISNKHALSYLSILSCYFPYQTYFQLTLAVSMLVGQYYLSLVGMNGFEPSLYTFLACFLCRWNTYRFGPLSRRFELPSYLLYWCTVHSTIYHRITTIIHMMCCCLFQPLGDSYGYLFSFRRLPYIIRGRLLRFPLTLHFQFTECRNYWYW